MAKLSLAGFALLTALITAITYFVAPLPSMAVRPIQLLQVTDNTLGVTYPYFTYLPLEDARQKLAPYREVKKAYTPDEMRRARFVLTVHQPDYTQASEVVVDYKQFNKLMQKYAVEAGADFLPTILDGNVDRADTPLTALTGLPVTNVKVLDQ